MKILESDACCRDKPNKCKTISTSGAAVPPCVLLDPQASSEAETGIPRKQKNVKPMLFLLLHSSSH